MKDLCLALGLTLLGLLAVALETMAGALLLWLWCVACDWLMN